MSKVDQKISHIVIEGGPAGGKTTAIPIIAKYFKDHGYLVLISRETPTWLCEEFGYDLRDGTRNISNEDFQELVLGSVIEQEQRLWMRAVKSGCEKVLILSDRGRFGGMGYVDREWYLRMAKQKFGQHMKELYNYDGCIFLQSLAVDQPEKYLEVMRSNPARREVDVVSGVEQNNNSLKACLGVGRLTIINNQTSLEEKIKRAIKVIEHYVGDSEYERKFAAKDSATLSFKEAIRFFKECNVAALPAFISQAYLVLTDEDRAKGIRAKRVRSLQLGSKEEPETYYLTKKGSKVAGGGAEFENAITQKEYLNYVQYEVDPGSLVIYKTRFYFIAEGRYWELDVFMTPKGQAFILECEHLPDEEISKIAPPQFFGALIDVTDDPKFSNQMIAKKK